MDEVHRIIAEGRALTRSLAVIEVGASPTEARLFCSSYLQTHEVGTIESVLIDGALRRICGLHRRSYGPTPFESSDTRADVLFREGAIGWMQWALDVEVPLLVALSEERRRSELDRMALTQWLEAVEQLRRGNTTEGRRFFRRAVKLGGLYGTPSNPVIQWTYAASFFPLG